MFTLVVQIIFGWPAIIFSIVISVIGILKKWPWMLAAGGVVIFPFSFYLSGFPVVRFLALLLPFFQFGAAWVVHTKRNFLAWVMLFPLASVSLILATIVLTQK